MRFTPPVTTSRESQETFSLSLPIIQAVLAEDLDEKPVVVSPYLVEEPTEETVSV